MKYRKKSIICNLLAGLIILIGSCQRRKPAVEILATKDINFPSASAIEFYENKLYVFGDDAAYLLRLTTNYEVLDSFFFFGNRTGRIPKNEKHDIESAFISTDSTGPTLYGNGSASNSNRQGVFAYDLKTRTIRNASFFPENFRFPSIEAVNLEGSCKIKQTIVFASRANLSNPVNHLIFFNKERKQVRVSTLVLPATKTVSGVSGLFYEESNDLLLFTASEEETASTVSDGTIGDSYIGWIENFSKKINNKEFKPDQFLKLSEGNDVFKKQKIESVCVEKANGKQLTAHLVADNDNGTSKFFKIRITL